MDCSRPLRRPCLIENDYGLASLADMEAGYLGSSHYKSHNQNGFFSRYLCYSRGSSGSNSSNSSSMRNPSSSVSYSPRSARFYDARFEERQPHFLDACFLCKKPLRSNQDIFMYRGDTPFCSEECRLEQILIDEANEKKLNLYSSIKALRKKEQRKSTSPARAHDHPFRTFTVAAA